jgi:hypothetical protein
MVHLGWLWRMLSGNLLKFGGSWSVSKVKLLCTCVHPSMGSTMIHQFYWIVYCSNIPPGLIIYHNCAISWFNVYATMGDMQSCICTWFKILGVLKCVNGVKSHAFLWCSVEGEMHGNRLRSGVYLWLIVSTNSVISTYFILGHKKEIKSHYFSFCYHTVLTYNSWYINIAW